MGFLSNKISRESLKPGDHIYTWQRSVDSSHHGIHVSEGEIIHFTNDAVRGNFVQRCASSSSGSSQVKSAIPCPQCGDCSKNEGVTKSCLDCFLDDGELYLFEYAVSKYYFLAKSWGGGCSLARSDLPERAVYRASYLFKKGFGAYDVLENNSLL